MTTAILLNAVYFKGTWLTKFAKGNSRPGAFHAPSGEKQVDFMRQEQRYAVGEAAGLGQAVALPYAKGRSAHGPRPPRVGRTGGRAGDGGGAACALGGAPAPRRGEG